MSNAEQLSNEVSKERQMAKAALGPVELQSLPTRKYLDETVMPLLLEGLAILSKVWARNLENNFLENSIASLNRRFKKFFSRSALRRCLMRLSGSQHFYWKIKTTNSSTEWLKQLKLVKIYHQNDIKISSQVLLFLLCIHIHSTFQTKIHWNKV